MKRLTTKQRMDLEIEEYDKLSKKENRLDYIKQQIKILKYSEKTASCHLELVSTSLTRIGLEKELKNF